jgi:hypothetical protein
MGICQVFSDGLIILADLGGLGGLRGLFSGNPLRGGLQSSQGRIGNLSGKDFKPSLRGFYKEKLVFCGRGTD